MEKTFKIIRRDNGSGPKTVRNVTGTWGNALAALRDAAFDTANTGRHGDYPLDLEEFNGEVESGFSDDGTTWTAQDGLTLEIKQASDENRSRKP